MKKKKKEKKKRERGERGDVGVGKESKVEKKSGGKTRQIFSVVAERENRGEKETRRKSPHLLTAWSLWNKESVSKEERRKVTGGGGKNGQS